MATKNILRQMNGSIKSGTMTALMGPSGAGKSTLLNCVTGKIKSERLKGECVLRTSSLASQKESEELRIGFVPQYDSLFTLFTVEETLLFASRLNNKSWDMEKHKFQVRTILESLDLHERALFPLTKLSGGQLKRVSVATELISSPAILVLDEPTSGLDSDSAESLIKLLKRVAISPDRDFINTPAIIATIHSPNYEVFSTFDTIYLLNKRGGNIYNGPPSEIMSYFKSIGFRGADTNPADYAIDVANGKYGEGQFDRMEEVTREQSTTNTCSSRLANLVSPGKSEIPMAEFVQGSSCPMKDQVSKLISRSLAIRMIKSPQAIVLALMHVATGMLLVHLHAIPVGHDPICWEQKVVNDSIDRSEFIASDLIYETKLRFDVTEKIKSMTTVIAFTFMTTAYFMFINGLVALVLTPYEFPVIKKELNNSYYTLKSFYLSKIASDSIVLFVTLIPAVLYIYYFSGQLMDTDNLWRIPVFFILVLLFSSTWDSIGSIVGLLVSDTLFGIAVLISLYLINMFISDFVVKSDLMIKILAFLLNSMSVQAAFTAILVTLYGYERCSPITSAKLLDLSSYRLPSDLFNRIWYGLNFQYEDMRRQARVLDTEVDYMFSFYDYVVNWLGSKKGPKYDNPSFLLDHYNLVDSITNQMTVILIWLVLSKILYWFALKHRSDKLEWPVQVWSTLDFNCMCPSVNFTSSFLTKESRTFFRVWKNGQNWFKSQIFDITRGKGIKCAKIPP